MANGKIEHRMFKAELRTNADGEPEITGYAAVFNVATDLGFFHEEIAPGAFSRALAEKQDVRCLMNHDPNRVLGRTKNGTLTLAEDNTGLKFKNTPPDTQLGKDCHTLVKRGDIDQCSFAFVVKSEDVTYGDNGDCLRTVKDVDLMDVSIVTYPAYESTSCEARSLADVAEQCKKKSKDLGTKPDGKDPHNDTPDATDTPSNTKPNDPATAVTPSRSKEWYLTYIARMDDEVGDHGDESEDEPGDESDDRCNCRCGKAGCASRVDQKLGADSGTAH
jgi:HK97 family phage prohead protease